MASVRVHKNIIGLDITVAYAKTVEIRKASENLIGEELLTLSDGCLHASEKNEP